MNSCLGLKDLDLRLQEVQVPSAKELIEKQQNACGLWCVKLANSGIKINKVTTAQELIDDISKQLIAIKLKIEEFDAFLHKDNIELISIPVFQIMTQNKFIYLIQTDLQPVEILTNKFKPYGYTIFGIKQDDIWIIDFCW